ncbi:hypothetical protein ACJMK2_033777 [Sinanodonta woodiana]|uniref:Uncharacterized protein n=1 Tax=Sinanodonta woodiana TaxID=1069815 RepID=A0ABD3WRJ8_SINWO
MTDIDITDGVSIEQLLDTNSEFKVAIGGVDVRPKALKSKLTKYFRITIQHYVLLAFHPERCQQWIWGRKAEILAKLQAMKYYFGNIEALQNADLNKYLLHLKDL